MCLLSALHVLAAAEGFAVDREGGVLLPFAWSDVTLHARMASELRVRLDLSTCGEVPEQASGSMVLCDGTGQPVATVGCLTLRRATAEQVRAAVQSKREGELSGVSWRPVPMALSAVAPEKVVVVGGAGWVGGWARGRAGCRRRRLAGAVGCRRNGSRPSDRRRDDVARVLGREGACDRAAVHVAGGTARVLQDVQALLSDARLAPAALMWVTSSAISTGADDGVVAGTCACGGCYAARAMSTRSGPAAAGCGGGGLTGERLWPLLAADGEPELVFRNRRALAARLTDVTKAS